MSLFFEERDLALAYAYVVLGSAVAQACVLTCTCPALISWATISCRGPLPATAQAAEPVVQNATTEHHWPRVWTVSGEDLCQGILQLWELCRAQAPLH